MSETEYVIYDQEKFEILQQKIAEQKQLLLGVLTKHAVPDPKLVGKLPKGGIQLDFVGHADITRILIEIDPMWEWNPISWENGRPQIHVENGMATMWGELTLLGHTRLGVGSCRADKGDLDKELVSDFLRNAAMRFGISLSLWTKAEWEDLGATHAPAPVARKVKAVTETKVASPVGGDTIKKFIAACDKAGLDYEQVADHASIDLTGQLNTDDLTTLRNSFNTLKGNK